MKKILNILLVIFFFSALIAQKPIKESQSQPIILRNSDSLLGSKTEAGNIREFIGNVVFEQGNVIVRGDRAIHFIDENKAEIFGNVKIFQDDMLLQSDEIHYNGSTGIAKSPKGISIKDKKTILSAEFGEYNTKTQIADFINNVNIADDTVKIKSDSAKYFRNSRISYVYGNVKIEDDSTVIIADIIEYNRNDRQSKAYGNVFIQSKIQRVFLTGDSVMNYPSEKYTIATGKPTLIQIDTLDKRNEVIELTDINPQRNNQPVFFYNRYYAQSENKSIFSFRLDTIIISADTMESFRSGGKELYYFKKNVQFFGSNIKGKADLLIYDRIQDVVELFGNPIVWYDSTQIVGDTLKVQLKNKKINEITALGNAFTASRDDTLNPTRINQIFGQRILIRFENDTINGVFSYGDAKSLYFLRGEESEEGVSRYGCDSLYVEFKDGKAIKIHWLGSVVGEYIPENILFDSPEYYFLPNFIWNDKKPAKKQIKIRFI